MGFLYRMLLQHNLFAVYLGIICPRMSLGEVSHTGCCQKRNSDGGGGGLFIVNEVFDANKGLCVEGNGKWTSEL